MRVNGEALRSLWVDASRVWIIDQNRLPHHLVRQPLDSAEDAWRAIAHMQVRGAPLIGATGAYGLALALRDDPTDEGLDAACRRLASARPTAVNLGWALGRVAAAVHPLPPADRADAAWVCAANICEEDVALCSAIGDHGLELIRVLADTRPTVQVLTHCNAGWLATVDWGTALAPVYKAIDAGLDVHVWVDETRPRNQGGLLTAWELEAAGVPHTVITDNAGGRLMQLGEVDLCLVGTDRTTATGDVCNKIGTYLKALAARDNGVPFYVCAPSPSIDWALADGRAIPVESRSDDEVRRFAGAADPEPPSSIWLVNPTSPVRNDAFDVTPARLVTGLVTERGVCPATREGLLSLFPEHAALHQAS